MPQLLAMRCILFASLLLAVTALQADELPRLRDLLPENTLAYVEVRDYQRTTARMQQSAVGRLAREPELAQFAETITQAVLDYQFPASAVARQRGETGGIANAWRELFVAPLGQIVVAAIAVEPEPILVVLVESRSELLQTLVDDQIAAFVRRGGKETTEKRNGGNLRIVEQDRSSRTLAAVLEREEVYALCDDPEVLRQIAAAWSGRRSQCLAHNPRFRKWQQRQASESEKREEPGDVEWFVDLAKLLPPAEPAPARNARRKSQPTADPGVEALWAELRFAEDRADLLLHVELMLSQPRTGVGKLLSFLPGEVTAEDWVPREATSYATLRWDARKAAAAFQQLDAATFNAGASWFDQQVGPPDALEPWVDLFDDRISHAAWFSAISSPGPAQIWGVRVRSPDEARELAEKMLASAASGKREETHRGKRYLIFEFPRQVHCLGTYDRCLLIANSPEAMRRAIDAALDKSERLSEQIDYRLVASQGRRLSSDQAAAAQFVRPVDYLRHLHSLLGSETFRDSLRAEAQYLPWLIALERALAANPLPDFALIDKHCAPGGGVVFQTPDSVICKAFLMRRK